jgi:hypothetical protein
MSRVVRLSVTAGLALLVFGSVPLPSFASCNGPVALISSSRVQAGGELVVRGRHFGTACNDVCSIDVGSCTQADCDDVPPLGDPARDIEIRLVSEADWGFPTTATAGVVLRTDVAAAEDYTFRVAVEIPAYTQPGRYYLLVGDGFTRQFRVKVGPEGPRR